MKISIVINCDTREGFNSPESSAEKMFDGCKSADFLIDGILNKAAFFEGFDIETIVYIDEHQDVPNEIFGRLLRIVNVLVVRKHTNEPGFNDKNYLRALELASGDIIVHFDQDTACYASSKEVVQEYIGLLDSHTVVSYPHWFSPNPDTNDNYDYWWASTRFFMCKREFLDIPEIRKCLDDNDYMYATYPASVRNPWTEHAIGLLAKYRGNGVFYPPMNLEKLAIFSWGSYKAGTLQMLNNMNYDQVKEWIYQHPIHYPNDIDA